MPVTTDTTDSWRPAWEAAAPHLPTEGLESLRRALLERDPRLCSGVVCGPPPLLRPEAPVDVACALAWVGWHGWDLRSVAQVHRWFYDVCALIDRSLGRPHASSLFYVWWDLHGPEVWARELVPAIDRELQRRQRAGPAA